LIPFRRPELLRLIDVYPGSGRIRFKRTTGTAIHTQEEMGASISGTA
jgi:hypothetical protein